MKQTAVQWLAFNLGEHIVWEEKIIDLVDQALEMEKEQIFDAVYFGHLKGWLDNGVKNSFGEQYYKETFKQTEQ